MTKDNYITASKQDINSFFYIRPIQGVSSDTATLESTTPTEFVFTDQTDGDIVQRYWIFDGDGTIDGVPVQNQSYQENNPNNHSVKFVYDKKGSYRPSLIAVLENSLSKSSTTIFHAGTEEVDGRLVGAKGRLLTITGIGASLEEARKIAYATISQITIAGAHFRTDIASLKQESMKPAAKDERMNP